MNFKFKMFNKPPVKNKEDKKPGVLDNAPKRPEVSKDYSDKRAALVKYLNKLQTRHDKDHKLDMIQTSPKIKAEQMERIFNLAEAVQRKIDGNDIAREDFDSLLKTINGIYPELVEPLKVSYTNPERGRQLLAAALAALITLSSVQQTLANTNTPGFTSGVNTTITFDAHRSVDNDATLDLTKSGFKVEGGGEGPRFESDPITLASAFFKTGTIVYKNTEARENAKESVRAFLKGIDLNHSKIIVSGLSSKERPTEMNKTLAQQRTEEGVRLVREVLSEDYPGQNIVIETVVLSDASVYDGLTDDQIAEIDRIKDASPEEFAKLVDSKQSINIQAVEFHTEEEKPVQKQEKAEPKLEEFNYVFVDRSSSMNNDISDVDQELSKIRSEKGKDIKTITVEGGTQEAHLRTLYNFLLNYRPSKGATKVLLLTDEPDNQVAPSNYEYNISHLLGLARDKNVEIVVKVFNPDKNIGGYKIFSLNDKNHRKKLLAPINYSEGPMQKDWYNSL